MGFNLKMFFEELEEILNEESTYKELYYKLKTFVKEEKQYAKDCGQL